MKKFILNADTFGKSLDYNRAVLNGYNNGFVKSASILANGDAFETAVNEILPECQHLSVGVHLNLTEGFPLVRSEFLTDNTGEFNNSFMKLVKLSKKTLYLKEIEREFRAQIEKVQQYTKISHIDSLDGIHCIPEIFILVCRLAQEYGIPYVRTHFEEFYIVKGIKYYINPKFILNFLKLLKFNFYSKLNINTIKKYNLTTNNYVIGISYCGMMDEKTVESGLNNLKDEDNIIVEGIIHPCSYLSNINNSHSTEFKLTQNKILEDNIYRMGFEITSHKI